MDAQLVLTVSLVIFVLPLAGSLIQLLFGRMKVPVDYMVDPHESPDFGSVDGGNVADVMTSDHTQRTVDLPHGAEHGALRSLRRGLWSDADQRRAIRLSWIATGIIGLCLIGALWVAVTVIAAPAPAGVPSYYPKAQRSALWFDFADAATSAIGHGYTVTLGILADNLTAVMLVVVTLISLLVHLFSSEYMRSPSMHGGRLNRYYAFLGLFTFSMLGIVIANSLLMLYIFWELVGLSSYLLIGFWYERPAAQYASMKAFLTNRIGDVGMFAGIMIIYTQLGTFQLTAIFDQIGAGHLPFGSEAWLTAAGILLFCGAIGKSAQFPLNVWLPDAMEGPTPVSALIHAATMVAAGVYLTARIFPLLTGDAMLFIATIGAVTALVGASIALVQWDLKKVLAFSTVSQLGYMVMALGVGAYPAAIFHLVTHAMFKACLFLCSGSVIHQMHHALHDLGDHRTDPQDMRNMGGLRRRMPLTFAAALVATLAISGVPLFSGYMSKEEILTGAVAFWLLSPHMLATVILVIGYAVAGMTAFYMFRMLFLTFYGPPRVRAIYDRIRENRRVMILPLVILAALSLWLPFGANPLDPSSGWLFERAIRSPLSVVPLSSQPRTMQKTYGMRVQSSTASEFQQRLDREVHLIRGGDSPSPFAPSALVALLVAAAGVGLAFRAYGRGETSERAVTWAQPRGFRALLANRWYQDNLYENYFPVGVTMIAMRGVAWFDLNVVDGMVNALAAGVVGLARLASLFDLYVVDGIVNFLAGTTQFLGMTMRQLQTGRIQTYVVYVVLGVVVLFFLFR